MMKSMMKLTPSKLRIIVCTLIGLGFISSAISIIQTANLVEMTYAPLLVVMGYFMILFAFRPRLDKDIVNAVTKIMLRRRH